MDALDSALDRLAGADSTLRNGLSNHGPMTAEALVRLGRAEVVAQWVDRYQVLLAPAPPPGSPIPSHARRARLGDAGARPDWLATWRAELGERPWQTVVGEAADDLLPGLWAEAGHGLIRTGHAVRALGEDETPPRLDELARGLAVWAAGWFRWPGTPTLDGERELRPAIEAVAAIPLPDESGDGITRALAGLLDDPARSEFSAGVGALGLDLPVSRGISALTAAAARVLLANGEGRVIPLVHALTTPAALRLVLPVLGPDQARAGLRAAWHACAAIYAGFAPNGAGPRHVESEDEREALVELAIANGDEHAIKMVEACLREHDVNPDPAYLAAARRTCELITW